MIHSWIQKSTGIIVICYITTSFWCYAIQENCFHLDNETAMWLIFGLRNNESELFLFFLLKQRLPVFQPYVQLRVICPQDKYNVKPAFWENVAAMIVDNHATFNHPGFQLVNHLQEI